MSGCGYDSPEKDQIFVPVATSVDALGDIPEGYRPHTLLNLFGFGSRRLRSWEGFGLAPLRFITQRGPLQDGETALDMRWDTRTVQILLAETIKGRTELWDRKWDFFDLLRPNRSFGSGSARPLIYRKWLPGGKVERGTDLETASNEFVTSQRGRFIERGLEAGHTFTILSGADAGSYTVVDVPNDYTVELDEAMGATATNVHWQYRRGWGKRDLYCLLEQGPSFDQGPGTMPAYPNGYREALRLVAHDPFWYGMEQSETWSVATVGALIFEPVTGADVAWFGLTAGAGEWFFDATGISDVVEVVYWGTVGAKPIIAIEGPASNPSIANNTLDTTITMTYDIAAGEVVTINTQTLTVENDAGDNLTPYTVGDLATFELSPPPQAADRINEVQVSFSGGDTNTQISMTWRNRYVGLQ